MMSNPSFAAIATSYLFLEFAFIVAEFYPFLEVLLESFLQGQHLLNYFFHLIFILPSHRSIIASSHYQHLLHLF